MMTHMNVDLKFLLNIKIKEQEEYDRTIMNIVCNFYCYCSIVQILYSCFSF